MRGHIGGLIRHGKIRRMQQNPDRQIARRHVRALFSVLYGKLYQIARVQHRPYRDACAVLQDPVLLPLEPGKQGGGHAAFAQKIAQQLSLALCTDDKLHIRTSLTFSYSLSQFKGNYKCGAHFVTKAIHSPLLDFSRILW
jgi:hypothetical protein